MHLRHNYRRDEVSGNCFFTNPTSLPTPTLDGIPMVCLSPWNGVDICHSLCSIIIPLNVTVPPRQPEDEILGRALMRL